MIDAADVDLLETKRRLSPDGARFEDFPVRRSRESYRSVVDRFVAGVAKAPGVVAVRQFGGVSAPGISDIDLLVETNPELTPEDVRILCQVRDRLPSDDRQYLVHDPVFCPAERFDLVSGFLHGEGVVRTADDIVSMRYCADTDTPRSTTEDASRS